MKKTFALVLSLFVLANVFATDVVPVENAQKASKNFLSARYHSLANIKTSDLTLKHTELNENGEPVYYRFQIKDKGFILVSATDLVSPILGYSIESNYIPNEGSDFIVNSYKTYIQNVQATGIPAANATKSWNQYLSNDFVQTKAGLKKVDRLLTSLFNQEYPFNTYCPYDKDAHKIVPNGCVAVNMITILNYYRYPTTGVGGVSYIPEGYPRQTVKFFENTYNYDAITQCPSSDNTEIAKLAHHAGVSVRMGYGATGSGAVSPEALDALKNYWQMDKGAYQQTQDVFSGGAKMWGDSILKPEIDAFRPLYYSAQDAEENGSGHAFMVDGYYEALEDSEVVNYFHINWGWGGACNGEFKIDYLHDDNSPEFPVMGNFIYHVGTFLKLCPPDSACQKPAESFTRNTASSGSISDGAGHMDYQNNSNRTWMIAAPNAKSYTFYFGRLNTEKLQDFITIYNGPSESDGVAYTFSGHYDYEDLPEAVTINADSVLVKFTSDGSNTDKGFVLYYNSVFKSNTDCSNIQMLSANKGVISEGSQAGKNYRGQQICSWRINVNGATSFLFNFKKFELGEGDFIDILDKNDMPLERFDNKNYRAGYHSYESSNRITVKFTADNWDEADGFELEYLTGKTGIEMESGLQNVSVYPNPATDYLNVEFEAEKPENVAFKVLDVTGKVVYAEEMNYNGGQFQHRFDISNLSEGFYIMNIETAQGKTVRKFIVH